MVALLVPGVYIISLIASAGGSNCSGNTPTTPGGPTTDGGIHVQSMAMKGMGAQSFADPVVGSWDLDYHGHTGTVTVYSNGQGSATIDGGDAQSFAWEKTGENTYTGHYMFIISVPMDYQVDTDTITSSAYPDLLLKRV